MRSKPLPKEKQDSSRDNSRDRSRDRSHWLTRPVDFEEPLFNFAEDGEMERINRRALLGKCSVSCITNVLNLNVVNNNFNSYFSRKFHKSCT